MFNLGRNSIVFIVFAMVDLQCWCSAAVSKIECINEDVDLQWAYSTTCQISGIAFEDGHSYEIDNMENIEYFVILNANTTHLPLALLSNMKRSLMSFKLTSSTLETLDATIELPSLQHLNLSMNHIAAIASDSFTGCPNLREIALKMNHIAALPGGIFTNLPHLVHIDLSSNKLTSVPVDVFSENPLLEIVLLQSNSLEELAMVAFANATQLKELDVSNNYLHKFLPSDTFVNMHRESSILDLSNNLLNLLNLTTIRATNIIVNSNYLQQLAIGGGCRELFAKNNELADISIAKASTSTLQMLQMNHNKLSDESLMSICECVNLQSIFLAHNNITRIGFCFSRARRLKEINLSRNSISHLDYGYFSSGDFLETLDLSYNSFATIDSDVLSLFHSLRYLYLDGNHLSDFPEDLDIILPHLVLIGLSHNRFECKKLLKLYQRWKATNRIAFNVDEPAPTNTTNIRGIICHREENINQDIAEDDSPTPSLDHLNNTNNALWKELQTLRVKLEDASALLVTANHSLVPEKSHRRKNETTTQQSDAIELDFPTTELTELRTEEVHPSAQKTTEGTEGASNETVFAKIFQSLAKIESGIGEMEIILRTAKNSTAAVQLNGDGINNERTFATISIILAVIVLILGAAILWYNYHSYFYYRKLRNHNTERTEPMRTFPTM